MAEELERAGANAINQYMTKEDYERLKNNPNETFEVGLVYNKTRGRVWDGLESIVGKMQNGSPQNFGLTTGVSRGMKDALSTYDPNVTYEVRGYSQGNINLEGALNDMVNKGEKFAFLNGNHLEFSHTGSPKANKVFDALSEKVGATKGSVINIGSSANKDDWITSEHAKSIYKVVPEMTDISVKYYEDIEKENKKFYQEKFHGTPIAGEAISTIQIYNIYELPSTGFEKGKRVKDKSDFTLDDMKTIVKTQNLKGFEELNKYQTIDDVSVNLLSKFQNYINNHHGMYFNKDIEIANQIMELEKTKQDILKQPKSSDNEINKLKEINYNKAVDKQIDLKNQRITNVIEMLKTVPRVNADYGKDRDKDLFEARDNILIEQLNKDFPRNNPYKNINPNEGLNMPKPEINREKSQNINEQLKKLRERVGN